MKDIKEVRGMFEREIEKEKIEECINNKGLVYMRNKTRSEVEKIYMNDIEKFIEDSKLPRIGKNILLNSKAILEKNGVDEMIMVEYVGVNGFSNTYQDISLLLDDDCNNYNKLLDMIVDYVDFYFDREQNHAYWLLECIRDLDYNDGYDKKKTLDFFKGVKNKEEEYKEEVIRGISTSLIIDVLNYYINYTINDGDLDFKERYFV